MWVGSGSRPGQYTQTPTMRRHIPAWLRYGTMERSQCLQRFEPASEAVAYENVFVQDLLVERRPRLDGVEISDLRLRKGRRASFFCVAMGRG